MKKLIFIMTMLILISMANHTVKAAPPSQVSAGEVYTVQAGDWLSKITENVYRGRLAYPVVVEATNARTAEDATSTVIENHDVIEVGQKLWIPELAEVSQPQTTEALPKATEIINYIPKVPVKIEAGHCWTSSIAAPGSIYAWRCLVGNRIYDPCLTATDGQTIVCGVPDEEFVVKLTESLPAVNTQTIPVHPWMFELTNGTICRPFTGTLPPLEEVARYGCNDETIILGDLQQGSVWYARQATITANERGPLPYKVAQETLVPIRKVWLVGDPTKG